MNDWITKTEAANRLGISTQTIDRMRRDNELRSKRIGRRIWIWKADVEKVYAAPAA